MVNPKLIKRLLKELEAEKGCPVQLKVEIPDSFRYADGIEYFGDFSNRSVTVERVVKLDKKYYGDVRFLEGEYLTLAQLQRRIEKLNVLHRYPLKGTTVERAFELVKKKKGLKELIGNSLAWNFKTEGNPFGMISASDVYEILDRACIRYLKHNIVARPDGVYDDRTSGGSISVVDETKVADITLRLIE